jgi:membrane protein implicated in regulation of membrane protease activity
MDWSIFSHPAVIWFLIGLVLLLLEFLIPGLIIFFFGIGAWITALAFLIFTPDINIQIVIFLVSSVLALVLLRRYLKKRFFKEGGDNTASLDNEFIGRTAVAETDIPAEGRGKINFKGTLWNADSEVDIKKGDRVIILAKESITLKVKPKD